MITLSLETIIKQGLSYKVPKLAWERGAAPLTDLLFTAAASRSWRYFTKYFGVNVEELEKGRCDFNILVSVRMYYGYFNHIPDCSLKC